jgi:hypothetical protein
MTTSLTAVQIESFDSRADSHLSRVFTAMIAQKETA